MKAAQISTYGDTSVININEIDVPMIKKGHVLVDVYAASINPFDTMVRSGAAKDSLPVTFPMTVGGDFSGIVLEVGEDITHIKVGDKVYGESYGFSGMGGALEEVTIVKADQVALAPVNIDFEQSSALPLVGVSALQAIKSTINVQPGNRVLINGGGGAIGSIAIQIAKDSGAYIVATATGSDLDYVKQLGADEAIDYARLNFSEIPHDFDAVFDTAGGDNFNRSFEVLKKGGIAVSMAAQPDEAKAAALGITALMQMTDATTNMLDKLRELVEAGAVTVRVGGVFSFDQVREAFQSREDRSIRGKIVIKVKS